MNSVVAVGISEDEGGIRTCPSGFTFELCRVRFWSLGPRKAAWA